ncbi:hypothetical protein [Tenacibaculum piscium]|nr:hypothetical protein [Tenacibaculum piscium]
MAFRLAFIISTLYAVANVVSNSGTFEFEIRHSPEDISATLIAI